jgi:predicted transcriptional regulator
MPVEPTIGAFHPERPGIRAVLGDLEAEIMEFVWSRPLTEGTTVRTVFEVLYARRRIAYTTVMSTMTRLAKKNLLRAARADRAYLYYPTVTQQEFVSCFVGRILEDLLVSFTGEGTGAVPATPDAQTLARARVLLDEIERRRAVEQDA